MMDGYDSAGFVASKSKLRNRTLGRCLTVCPGASMSVQPASSAATLDTIRRHVYRQSVSTSTGSTDRPNRLPSPPPYCRVDVRLSVAQLTQHCFIMSCQPASAGSPRVHGQCDITARPPVNIACGAVPCRWADRHHHRDTSTHTHTYRQTYQYYYQQVARPSSVNHRCKKRFRINKKR